MYLIRQERCPKARYFAASDDFSAQKMEMITVIQHFVVVEPRGKTAFVRYGCMTLKWALQVFYK
jgi:hypothetical protein